jgi:hypothetical protein
MGRPDLLRKLIKKDYEQYSGLILEDYFREKMIEGQEATAIGNYWDNKGENEIDLIILNDLDKTARVVEIKRNPKKIRLTALIAKADHIRKELADYSVEYEGWSMEDM